MTSPLEELTVRWFGRRTTVVERVVTVDTTVSQILRNDPNRYFIALINEGSADCRVSTSPTITTSSGWLLPANGGVMVFDWQTDGEAVGYAVYAVAAAGSATIRLREVVAL